MNEVRLPDGAVHESNTRDHLVKLQKKYQDQEPWFGIEQEYTFFRGRCRWGGRRVAIPHPKDRSIAVLVPMRSLAEKLLKPI